MIDNYHDIAELTQDLFCITYKGTADNKVRLCYLTRNNRPLFFFNFKTAQAYFNINSISTQTDRFTTWSKLFKGDLYYPDAKIVKVTLSNFEIAKGD